MLFGVFCESDSFGKPVLKLPTLGYVTGRMNSELMYRSCVPAAWLVTRSRYA